MGTLLRGVWKYLNAVLGGSDHSIPTCRNDHATNARKCERAVETPPGDDSTNVHVTISAKDQKKRVVTGNHIKINGNRIKINIVSCDCLIFRRKKSTGNFL